MPRFVEGRGLRVQSPSLTQKNKPVRRRSGGKNTQAARSALLGTLADRGLPVDRIHRIDAAVDAIRRIQDDAVLEAIRGWR